MKDDSFDCTLIAHLRIFLLFYRLLYCLILPENRLFFGIWKVVEIENKGQQPSLQIFYELVTRYDISVDQFFFPNKSAEKDTQRRQLDTLLDSMSEKGIRVVTATAKEIAEVEAEDR